MIRRSLLTSLACAVLLGCAPAREGATADTTTPAGMTDAERDAETRIRAMLGNRPGSGVLVQASKRTAAFCGLLVWKHGANPPESQRLVLMGDTLFLERSTPPDDFRYALAQC